MLLGGLVGSASLLLLSSSSSSSSSSLLLLLCMGSLWIARETCLSRKQTAMSRLRTGLSDCKIQLQRTKRPRIRRLHLLHRTKRLVQLDHNPLARAIVRGPQTAPLRQLLPRDHRQGATSGLRSFVNWNKDTKSSFARLVMCQTCTRTHVNVVVHLRHQVVCFFVSITQ